MVTKADVETATRNWMNWQDVFQYFGPPLHNPLLAHETRFKDFLKEYSVHRTIRRGASDNLRLVLGSTQFPLVAMLSDATGFLLDEQEKILRAQFGTCGGKRGLISALSKIAAFLAPHDFIA